MKRLMAMAALAAGMTAAGGALAQSPAPSDAEAGATVYAANCAVCHGERLKNPGGSFDLITLRPDEKPRFEKSVHEGKGQMPSWKAILTDQQIDQVWAYIRAKADN